MIEIKVKRLTETAVLPTRTHADDLGWDLYADLGGDPCTLNIIKGQHPEYVLYPRQTIKIPTGIAIELPAGWGAFIKPRSSQGDQSLDVFGGVMDNSYRGCWKVQLHNASTTRKTIRYRERIGQLVLIPQPESVVIAVNELSETTRGEKGFGSSGK